MSKQFKAGTRASPFNYLFTHYMFYFLFTCSRSLQYFNKL
uniref:Unclassified n=1 Tax=Fusarium pseudograminearum CS3487 TaxID=1318458 RepID=W1I9E4_FUSPS|nr:unclassified [Fusarium pseudograminearum CS3487]CDX48338.1 unclassified [Fusarium pseudograminearum CS3487]